MTEGGGRPSGEFASSELSRYSPVVEWPRRDADLERIEQILERAAREGVEGMVTLQ